MYSISRIGLPTDPQDLLAPTPAALLPLASAFLDEGLQPSVFAQPIPYLPLAGHAMMHRLRDLDRVSATIGVFAGWATVPLHRR